MLATTPASAAIVWNECAGLAAVGELKSIVEVQNACALPIMRRTVQRGFAEHSDATLVAEGPRRGLIDSMCMTDVAAALILLQFSQSVWEFIIFGFFSTLGGAAVRPCMPVFAGVGAAGCPGTFKAFFFLLWFFSALGGAAMRLYLPVFADFGAVGYPGTFKAFFFLLWFFSALGGAAMRLYLPVFADFGAVGYPGTFKTFFFLLWFFLVLGGADGAAVSESDSNPPHVKSVTRATQGRGGGVRVRRGGSMLLGLVFLGLVAMGEAGRAEAVHDVNRGVTDLSELVPYHQRPSSRRAPSARNR